MDAIDVEPVVAVELVVLAGDVGLVVLAEDVDLVVLAEDGEVERLVVDVEVDDPEDTFDVAAGPVDTVEEPVEVVDVAPDEDRGCEDESV